MSLEDHSSIPAANGDGPPLTRLAVILGNTGPVLTRYRMPGFVRPLSLGLAAVMTVLAVGFIVAANQMPAVLVLVVIVFVAVIIWTVFRTLFRRAYRLELTGDRLRWSAPLATGELRIDELSAVRQARVGPGIWVLIGRDSFCVSIPVRKGLRAFLKEIQVIRPDLRVNTEAWPLNYIP